MTAPFARLGAEWPPTRLVFLFAVSNGSFATAKTHERNDMGDDKYTDERLIAAMLANGLLSNSAKETTTRSQGTPAQAAVAIYFECLDALRLEREKRAQG